MITHPNLSTISNCTIPESAKVRQFTNLYDSVLGDDVQVGPFVEIGGATIGNRTKIGSHAYICPKTSLGEDCFIAHHVSFCNDKFSDVPEYSDIRDLASRWNCRGVTVGNRVRIGSGVVLLPGITIGDDVIIGAGAVVSKDVSSGTTVAGCPARLLKMHKP